SLAAAAFGISIPASGAPCPGGVPLQCYTNPVGQTWAIIIPGLVTAPLSNLGNRVVSPVAADYFRRVGPNYFFVSAVTGGLVNKATFDAAIQGSLRTPGLINPYADVNAQLSDGTSSYNAMNLELKKRFSTNVQF